MPKPRKMLGAADSPYIVSLMRLIETQSKATIAAWCIGYAAREAEDYPAAQAAARTCGQAAACIHTPTHSLGLAFYGSAAIAYDRVGTNEPSGVYDRIAAEECAKMEDDLRRIAVENEPHPAKINWHC